MVREIILSFICIVGIWLCCLTVTLKCERKTASSTKDMAGKSRKKSIEVSVDGGKVMKAIAETLVLVWMGYPVSVCAVCGSSDNITAIRGGQCVK